jgi:hypothetical protein
VLTLSCTRGFGTSMARIRRLRERKRGAYQADVLRSNDLSSMVEAVWREGYGWASGNVSVVHKVANIKCL